jgi:hypothetical protein
MYPLYQDRYYILNHIAIESFFTSGGYVVSKDRRMVTMIDC